MDSLDHEHLRLREEVAELRTQLAVLASELRSAREALSAAKEAMEYRLNMMNNMREELSDSKLQSVTRNEWATSHLMLNEKLEASIKTAEFRVDGGLRAAEARIVLAADNANHRISTVERMVWIGTGIAIAFSVALRFISH